MSPHHCIAAGLRGSTAGGGCASGGLRLAPYPGRLPGRARVRLGPGGLGAARDRRPGGHVSEGRGDSGQLGIGGLEDM